MPRGTALPAPSRPAGRIRERCSHLGSPALAAGGGFPTEPAARPADQGKRHYHDISRAIAWAPAADPGLLNARPGNIFTTLSNIAMKWGMGCGKCCRGVGRRLADYGYGLVTFGGFLGLPCWVFKILTPLLYSEGVSGCRSLRPSVVTTETP